MIFRKKNIAVPVEPQPTPYTNASILSKITYWWVNPIFEIGYKRPLENNDIYLLEKKYQEKNLAENFYKIYNNELNKKNKKPNIVKIFIKIFGPKWIPAGIFMVIADCCNVCSPIILELLLNYITNENTEASYKGWIYTALLLILQVLATLNNNYYFKIVMEVGLSAKATIISIIYRKTLKLSQSTKQDITEGQIINIISSDSSRIDELVCYLHSIWSSPLQLIVVLILLIRSLGFWALIGFSILVIFIPLQGFIINWLTNLREQIVGYTDERVKKTQEIISSMRVIKFFGWESNFLNIVNKLRSKELSRIKKSLFLFAGINSILDIIPVLASSLTFVGYALAGNQLTAAKVFSSLAFFGMLAFPLGDIPFIISELADSIIAFKRITNIINSEELNETFNIDPNAKYAISVKDGNFSWDSNNSKSKTESDSEDETCSENENTTLNEKDIVNVTKDTIEDNIQNENENNSKISYNPFKIKNINLNIQRNSLTAIVGSVGSGKSSLVNALIGEMKRESGEIIYCGSIGYCPQQAWIQNATIRDNILFGKEYNEEKYKKAIKSCALTHDLKIFPNGDMTEIGERGINLSGGQKQRISLARAVYYDSDILFLDDPLSAVDAHVSRYLFDNCILNALKNKTRILVTHQLHILPKVDYIIYLNNGEITEQGTYNELIEKGGEFSKLMYSYGGFDENSNKSENENENEISRSEQSNSIIKNENENKNKNKKRIYNKNKINQDTDENEIEVETEIINIDKKELITDEERYTGSVKFDIYKFYIKAAGGLTCVFVVTFFLIFSEVTKIGNDLWLTFWTDNKFNFSTLKYVIIYLGWSILQAIAKAIFSIIVAYAGITAAKKIHKDAIATIISAPISFFDTTPLGRIINRFSKDQDSVDNVLTETIQSFISSFAVTISSLIIIIYTTPMFIIPLIPLLIIYYIMQEYYRSTSREIKRLDSLSRSPLYANFNETMNGISTIRAYHEQKRFIEINGLFLDNNNRPCIIQINAQRWLSLRLEIIGSLLVFFAAASGMLLKATISPALLGLSLSYALNVTGYLNWVVREFSETEINMNAVERLSHYTNDIEIENQKGIDAPKDWPQTGKIEIKNLTMRYAQHLPPVLNNISLNIQGN
eukprot:jgi/Orpsp1_1/1174113/evm.model.c7180000048971.1